MPRAEPVRPVKGRPAEDPRRRRPFGGELARPLSGRAECLADLAEAHSPGPQLSDGLSADLGQGGGEIHGYGALLFGNAKHQLRSDARNSER
jgi:hypothetical protein